MLYRNRHSSRSTNKYLHDLMIPYTPFPPYFSPQPSISTSSPPPPLPFFLSSILFNSFCLPASTHLLYSSSPPLFNLAATTPLRTSPAKPTKLCFRSAFSNCHSLRLRSSRSSSSKSPISRARILKSRV